MRELNFYEKRKLKHALRRMIKRRQSQFDGHLKISYNDGFVGPNPAAFVVYEKGRRRWLFSSSGGQMVAVVQTDLFGDALETSQVHPRVRTVLRQELASFTKSTGIPVAV